MASRLITVIDAVSQASMEIGIAQQKVTQVIGSLDQDVAQLLALLSAVADEVLDNQPYEETLGDGYWLRSQVAGKLMTAPAADSDVILFDGRLAVNGLKYRFLKVKGLEFGEDLRDFASRMNKLATRANSRVLDLDAETEVVQ